MRILVTGASGQLGHEFKNTSNSNHDFYFTDENNLDITKKSKFYITLQFIKFH